LWQFLRELQDGGVLNRLGLELNRVAVVVVKPLRHERLKLKVNDEFAHVHQVLDAKIVRFLEIFLF
jgi:hypothetical protein